jgi:hypothetical protein
MKVVARRPLRTEGGLLAMARDYKSPPMAMMPPTIVVTAASAPTVMMAATAVMAPPMTAPVTVAAPDLNDRSIGAAENT